MAELQTSSLTMGADATLEHVKTLLEQGRVDEARAVISTLAERCPESLQVQRLYRVLQPPRVLDDRGKPGRSLDNERAWLGAHSHEYPGCWLAVYGGRLLAASPERSKVVAAARRELGSERAVLFFQPAAVK